MAFVSVYHAIVITYHTWLAKSQCSYSDKYMNIIVQMLNNILHFKLPFQKFKYEFPSVLFNCLRQIRGHQWSFCSCNIFQSLMEISSQQAGANMTLNENSVTEYSEQKSWWIKKLKKTIFELCPHLQVDERLRLKCVLIGWYAYFKWNMYASGWPDVELQAYRSSVCLQSIQTERHNIRM